MTRRRSRYRGRHRARRSRGVRLVRAGAGLLAVGGIVLAITAFGPGYLERVWSTASADQRFVAAVQAEGRPVPSGDAEALVVQAAQKLCEGRDGSSTYAERRASALTADEIDAVRRTFGDDSEAFMKVARRTYCPLSPLTPS
jgi:Protein of unknown function (DUF732)